MSQVRVTHPLGPSGVCGAFAPVQAATGVGPVVNGGRQVVVVKLLPVLGPEAVQVCTGTPLGSVSIELFVPQVVAVKLLPIGPPKAGTGVHDATPVGPVVPVLQVVVTQLFPAVAALFVQVATGTLVVLLGELQVVVVNKLPAVAPAAVQVWTGTLVVIIGGGHVVVVNKFPAVGPDTTHVAMGVGPVLLVPQVVEVNTFPGPAAIGVHDATPVGPVAVFEQLVLVNALPASAAEGEQAAIGVGPVTTEALQVTLVKLLPAFATVAVHIAVG